MKLELDIFSTNMQVSAFLKINPVTAELLYAEREIDITEQIVTFRNFTKAS